MYYCGRRPLIRKLHICKAAFYLIISDTEKKINSHKVVSVRWIGGGVGHKMVVGISGMNWWGIGLIEGTIGGETGLMGDEFVENMVGVRDRIGGRWDWWEMGLVGDGIGGRWDWWEMGLEGDGIGGR